jgi:hypothetical protein
VERDPSAALLAVLLLICFSFAILMFLGRIHGVVLIACIAFAARALRGVDVQMSGYASDAAEYDYFGQELARYWQQMGPDPGSWLGKDGFPTILAVIYTLIGHAPEVGYLVNALAGGLTVLVVAAICYQMGWYPAIKPAAWLVALWPVGVLWGGLLLREAIVGLLLGVGLWGTVRIYKQYYLSGAAAIIGSGLLMIPMRGGLAFLVIIGMPVTAAIAANVRVRLSVTTILFGIVAAGFTFVALQFLAEYFDGSRYFEYRADVSQEQNTGNSSFAQAGLGSGAVDPSLSGHALRSILTAFGPFPWQLTNPSLALAGIDAFLWLGIWTLCIYAVRKLKVRADAALFILPTAALLVYLAANSSNFGLIIRLRGLAIVLVAPLAALGWVVWRRSRAEKKAMKGVKQPREREPIPELEEIIR